MRDWRQFAVGRASGNADRDVRVRGDRCWSSSRPGTERPPCTPNARTCTSIGLWHARMICRYTDRALILTTYHNPNPKWQCILMSCVLALYPHVQLWFTVQQASLLTFWISRRARFFAHGDGRVAAREIGLSESSETFCDSFSFVFLSSCVSLLQCC